MAANDKKLPKQEIIIFSRQLSLVLDSEISLVEGIQMIIEKSDHKGLAEVLSRMNEKIKFGHSLSETIKEYETFFSPFFVSMIELGERSGDLAKSLEQVADAFEKEIETTEKVKSAITYPIILAILMTGVILLLIVEILPMFADILESLGGEMPAFTMGVLNIGLFIGNSFLWIVLIIATLIGGGVYYSKTEKGRYFFDRLKFRIPVQRGIVSSLTAVHFARNLAMLIRSGIPLSIGIRMLKKTIGNLYVAEELDKVAEALDLGASPDEEFQKLDLFPWVLIKLFGIAQTTGHMDRMLDKAADVMEKETDTNLDRLTTVIEPMLIIVLSLVVGAILISVILPIVNIMNSIG